jgi:uncharacterized protein YdeI (YjbR/CyaY-like superfamily)
VSEPGTRAPIFFASPEEFYAWLEGHHDTETEVYAGYYKAHTGRRGMSWSEAVDQALCFGWIDGRLNRIDDESHMQRFTPRKPGSNWSNVNVAKVEQLTKAGLMRPAGLAAFERRTKDRTGVYSFERENAGLPPEYEKRLRANHAAAEYFDSRPPWYRRAAVHWVTSAKREETRERRLDQLVQDSADGVDVKPLRRGQTLPPGGGSDPSMSS